MSIEETSTKVESPEVAKAAGSENVDAQIVNQTESNDSAVDPAVVDKLNQRLLDESKSNRSKYLQVKRELEAIKAKELEAEGKATERAKYYEEKYNNLYQQTIQSNIRMAVEREAAKAGCVDPDALLALGNKELLQYDEASGQVYGADALVDDAKKAKPYLFNHVTKTAINPTIPGGVIKEKQLTVKDIAKDNDAFRQALASNMSKRK